MAEFTKQFGPLTNNLAAGESVAVTSYGQVHGRYVREGSARRRPRLSLRLHLNRAEYPPKVGQQLIDRILAEA